ncbi:MAG: hypothetical protein ACKVHE_07815, partial [Planctomycetales bacterium]
MPDEANESSHPELNRDEPHGRFFLLAISSTAFACCVGATFVGQLATGTQITAGLTKTDLSDSSMWQAA